MSSSPLSSGEPLDSADKRVELANILRSAAFKWHESANRKSEQGDGITAGEFRENRDKLNDLADLINPFS